MRRRRSASLRSTAAARPEGARSRGCAAGEPRSHARTLAHAPERREAPEGASRFPSCQAGRPLRMAVAAAATLAVAAALVALATGRCRLAMTGGVRRAVTRAVRRAVTRAVRRAVTRAMRRAVTRAVRRAHLHVLGLRRLLRLGVL